MSKVRSYSDADLRLAFEGLFWFGSFRSKFSALHVPNLYSQIDIPTAVFLFRNEPLFSRAGCNTY